MLKKLVVWDNEHIIEVHQDNRGKMIHTRSKTEPFWYRCLYFPDVGATTGYEGESNTCQKDAYNACMKEAHK
jgi:hypothetical protein